MIEKVKHRIENLNWSRWNRDRQTERMPHWIVWMIDCLLMLEKHCIDKLSSFGNWVYTIGKQCVFFFQLNHKETKRQFQKPNHCNAVLWNFPFCHWARTYWNKKTSSMENVCSSGEINSFSRDSTKSSRRSLYLYSRLLPLCFPFFYFNWMIQILKLLTIWTNHSPIFFRDSMSVP